MNKFTIDDIGNDVLDLRDITDRFEELENSENPEDKEELSALEKILDGLKSAGGDHDWRGAWYPLTLIKDEYFETYAQELAEETGAIPREYYWPCSCIDWEQAARDLSYDYSSIDIDGISYYYR